MTTNLKLTDVRDNLSEKEKDIFSLKISIVNVQVKKILLDTNPGLIHSHVSLGKDVYEKILNTKNLVGNGYDENSDLILELSKIAADVVNEVNQITTGINSGKIRYKEFVEEDDHFYKFRHFIQKQAHEKLKEIYGEDLDIRQVYIYSDISIYKQLNDFELYLTGDYNDKIDILVDNFIEFYKNNEQLFIDRFKNSEDLGDVTSYNLDEAIRIELRFREQEMKKL